MIPASPESYDFQPSHILPYPEDDFLFLFIRSFFNVCFCWRITDWAAKLAGDRTHEWGNRWWLQSKSQLQTLSAAPQFYVFLQKRAFFRFCGRDPSKMTILAPSRKPVRIGLYREGRKGPKSTFFGWSVFGVLGFRRKLCASHLARPTPVVIAVEISILLTQYNMQRWKIIHSLCELLCWAKPTSFMSSAWF